MLDARRALEAIGSLPDSEIDPATAALQLARLDQAGAPGKDWLDASAHLSELARCSAEIGAVLSGRSAEVRIGALAGLIHARFGYRGDRETYDDLDNANLVRVIARRRGMPVALGVLWLHCLRAAGWEAHGVDFPGHFLVALAASVPGEAAPISGALVDCFDNGAVVAGPELVSLIRRIAGPDEPLRPGMLRPMSTRDVLLRLQRNLVQRRILAGALQAALGSLEGMLLLAPDIAPNWLEAADLHRRLGQNAQAVECLERFLDLVPRSDASTRARAEIEALRGAG